jgi:hypothetical protein
MYLLNTYVLGGAERDQHGLSYMVNYFESTVRINSEDEVYGPKSQIPSPIHPSI